MTGPTGARAGSRLGPYELLSLVGVGGMGEVYRAHDPRLSRDVAVKVLPAVFSSDPDRLRRFEQESRAAGSLNHPHVLTVHDVGVEGGVPYVVSELLEGETLGSRLTLGALPVRKTLELAREICDGLAAAHDKGIVHRDLKPENIFLTSQGHAKILDFGLAKLRTPSDTDESTGALAEAATANQTRAGVVLGTVGYMSPEQIRGGVLDGRSDIFSLGSVLYEMLSSRRPFRGPTSAETMHAILNEDPPALEDRVGPGIERVVRRCLEKRPEERFHSARDVAFALEAVSGSSGPAVVPQRLARWRRLPAFALATILVATGLAAYIAASQAGDATPLVFQKLTFRRGTIHAARFAPDGHTVVYGAAFEGAPTRVFTSRIEGPGFSPLALPDATLLAVSASGELALALGYQYAHNRGSGALARAPLAGGAPRDVLESVEGADWAPDGASLAVVRSAAGKSRLEFPIGRVLFETHGWISHPRVSPRGDAVAFLEHPNPDQSGSVAVVDTSGKVRILLADLISAYGLAWHPSGREVWFTGSRKAIDNSVRAVSLDGRERTVFEAPARLILHDIFPDGRALFATESLRGEIAGRGPGAPTERPLHWLDFSILNDLSPDGSRLLLTEGGEGAGVDFQIYLRKLDDSPAVHLGKGFGGSLSPDGKWVLASQPSGPQRLLLLPTGVGEELTIERHGIESYQTARWFPDGERIVFAGTEPGRGLRLYVQALAGGPPRAITAEGVRLAWLLEDAVSSDGRWVTAVGPDGAIGQYPVQGGDPQRLPGLDREDSLVRWIEYGRSAYVWRSNERPSPIYRLDLSNGRRTLVTSVLPADPTGVGGLLSLVMTSDASAYAYHYARHLGELYLVQGLR